MAIGSIGTNLGTRSLSQVKNLFWDDKRVIRAAGRAKANAQRRYGGYLKRVAQTSMRYTKSKPSNPGQPPNAHKDGRLAALKKKKRSKHNGALLREFLFNVRDPSGSQLIGPLGFKTRGGGTPVPALHEYGGTRAAYTGETMAVKNPAGRNPKTGRFYSQGVQLVPVTGTVTYPKRPTMIPALRKTGKKFPEAFRNSLSR